MDMEEKSKNSGDSLQYFHFPRYSEIPDVGLYLDQVVKFINDRLAPLGYQEITTNMVGNYVKKKYISAPVKKQYTTEQIVGLIVIYVTKSMLTMDKIQQVFSVHSQIGTVQESYDMFCEETEQHMQEIFSAQSEKKTLTDNSAMQILHSTAAAVAHTVYLNSQFSSEKKSSAADEK